MSNNEHNLSKRDMPNSNDNLKVKHLALLKRRAESAHQSLNDEETCIVSIAKEQRCDVQNHSIDDEPSLSYIKINCCPSANDVETCIVSIAKEQSCDEQNDSIDDEPSLSNIKINCCPETDDVETCIESIAKEQSCDVQNHSIDDEPSLSNVKIDYCLAKSEDACEPKDEHENDIGRTIDIAYSVAYSEETVQKPEKAIALMKTETPRRKTEIADADNVKQHSKIPMSTQAEERISSLDLDQEVSRYNIKDEPTNSSSIMVSESLARRVDFLKSGESAPKSEASGTSDIDRFVTEESQEDTNVNDDNVGKVSSLMNDFSFTFNQMMNNTFTSDEASVRSFGSSNEESKTDNKENLGVASTMADCKKKKKSTKRFPMSFRNVNTRNKSGKRTDSLSSAGSRDTLDGFKRFSVKGKGRKHKRGVSTNSASSNNSEHTSVQSKNVPSIKKFTMSLGNKVNWRRTNNTSINNISDDGSVPKPLLEDNEINSSFLDSDESDSDSFLISPSSMEFDQYEYHAAGNQSIDHSSSSDESVSSDSSDEFEEYAEYVGRVFVTTLSSMELGLKRSMSDIELGLRNNMLDKMEKSIHNKPVDRAKNADSNAIDFSMNNEFRSHEECGENTQSHVLTALSSTEIGLRNSMSEKIEKIIHNKLVDRDENADPNVTDFSMDDKTIASSETLGLEMIAHSELLQKYN